MNERASAIILKLPNSSVGLNSRQTDSSRRSLTMYVSGERLIVMRFKDVGSLQILTILSNYQAHAQKAV